MPFTGSLGSLAQGHQQPALQPNQGEFSCFCCSLSNLYLANLLKCVTDFLLHECFLLRRSGSIQVKSFKCHLSSDYDQAEIPLLSSMIVSIA